MRIKGFEKLGDMRSFSLVKREGEHTICKFTFRGAVGDTLPLLSLEGSPITVQRDDGSTMFYGILRLVSVEQSHHGAILSAEASSYSTLADVETHTRIFQNPTQKLQDFLPKLKWSEAKCELDLGEAGGKNPVGLTVANEETNSVIQNEETDFAFLRRLVDEQNFHLWIIDTNSGRTELRVAKHLTERQIIAKDIISITRQREQGKVNIFLRAAARAELDTGQQVKIEGIPGKFIVMTKTVKKERETFIFDYELKEETSSTNFISIEEKARVFAVEITDNNDPKHMGRVQVKFTDEKIEDMGEAPNVLWIPYRTHYAGKNGQGGIVFLPDIGDHAEALLLGKRLWIADSFRKESLMDECSKIEEKYIGNNTKQRIFWKEKSLEFFSFQNSIVMDEEKIILSIGDSKTQISMNKDKITLQTVDNTVELSPQGIRVKSERDIALHSEKNAQIKSQQGLQMESGKDYLAKAEGNMNVETSSKLTMNVSSETLLKSGRKITIDGSAVDIC